jgi:hypothetical protein
MPIFSNSGNFDLLKVRTDDEGRTLKAACCVCGVVAIATVLLKMSSDTG